MDPGSIYAQVGGEPTFRRLVAAFYAQVAEDPIMRPMYPEQDLGPAEDRLRLFLIQYFGGPTTYSQERGHPRLRMRHIPFAIDSAARDAWLRHMRLALDEVQLPPMYEAMMWDYFERAATAMVNTAG
ncbi:globin [Galactobacter caseinivorans]|uniref:globin n=1 Tax=Galactobacter caseinivorans TaxID=2676123 RepID=UPI002D76EE85|nr:globin [Galactobacter caseinivorans]